VTGAAERLRDGLHALGRVRVPLDAVLSVWASAAPDLTGSAESLAALAASLRALADAGLLELPAGRSWDRSTRPPLPRFVTVPGSRRERPPDRWRSFPWRKELGWVASLPYVGDTNFEALIAIDTWLARHDADGPPVPVRVRSAEVFGDEKRLDDFVKTRLFGPGRLSLELLGAVRYPPPLPTRLVGDGSSILIVENMDPFWVCVEAARTTAGSVGRVAWGAARLQLPPWRPWRPAARPSGPHAVVGDARSPGQGGRDRPVGPRVRYVARPRPVDPGSTRARGARASRYRRTSVWRRWPEPSAVCVDEDGKPVQLVTLRT